MLVVVQEARVVVHGALIVVHRVLVVMHRVRDRFAVHPMRIGQAGVVHLIHRIRHVSVRKLI